MRLHRPRGDDRDVAERGGLADGLGRAVHLGEAAAIGADGGEQVVFRTRASRRRGRSGCFRCRWRRSCGGSARGTGGPRLRSSSFRRTRRSAGKSCGFSDGQLELAALAADRGAVAVGLDAERGVAAFAEDGAEAGDRQHGGAGRLDFDAGDVVADADFEVGGHERGRVLGDLELDVLQDRLGAAGRGDGGDGLKGVQQFFAVAGDFHRRDVLCDTLILVREKRCDVRA